MNQDQVSSAVRSILKLLGAALVAHGATKAAAWVNAEDVAGLAVAIVGLVWSFISHRAAAGTSTGSVGEGPGSKVILFLLLPALVFGGLTTGCKSTPQQVAYQAAGTTSVTVESALAAYDVLAKAGKTSVAQNAQVKAAYLKYQAAFAVLCDAGAVYAATSTTNAPAAAALQQAVANANASINDVVTLVESFGVTLK